MSKISAIIVAKGNPPNIGKAIASVEDLVEEIIIGDLGIDDGLKTKLKGNAKTHMIEIKENVPYIELIREEIKKYASYEYVLFLDPDEELPPGITNTVKENLDHYDYIALPRKNIIFGQWIQHSRWWPDYQIRLFRKNKVIWPRMIHKQPTTEGKGLTLEPKETNAIIHHNYQNLDEYLAKALRYARSEAGEIIREKNTLTISSTSKKAVSEFISRYFAHEGYKDGSRGLILALLQMIYYFLVYAYYLENNHYEKGEDNPGDVRNFFKAGYFETNYWLGRKKLLGKIARIKLKIINRFI
jgi:(heptosyl)LPS beta-1,4-glucosyltransferase